MGRPLGQHFLFQRSILERIASAACPTPPPLCIEIGPGAGTLTELLLERTDRLLAVELDPALAARLRARYAADPRFELLEANVLDTDLGGRGPAVVCGNIPYYITSPIIEKALSLGPGLIRAVFLVQNEVAGRLAARHGSREYGYLTVATQALCSVEKLFVVKPSSFRPPPKVDSAVVRLTPRSEPLVADYPAFLRFASACFRQKRKTLRNNLNRADIPYASQRAEQLSLDQLMEVFRVL